jgi:hypothetical protein
MLRLALLEHKEKNGGWYGVDLDGTMAKYNTGDGVESIGEPVDAMIALVKEMLAEGKTVKIFTARVSGEDAEEVARQRAMIEAYTEQHVGQRLEVTHEKDIHLIELYDDRAKQVVRNEGTVVGA